MSGSPEPRTKEQLIDIAASFGCDAIFAEPHDIMLDVDEEKTPLVDVEVEIERYRGLLELTEVARWKSRNGGTHIHLRSTFPWSILERAAIQLLLKSDSIRENLAIEHYVKKTDLFPCLFKPKEVK